MPAALRGSPWRQQKVHQAAQAPQARCGRDGKPLGASLRTSRRPSRCPIPDPPGTYDANVSGTSIVQNSTGQHTIAWKEDLKGADGTVLPAGECNLYRFPRCNIGKRLGVLPEAAQLQLLCDLLVATAHPQEHIFFRRDPSGACPIHAILIANNMESLSLVLRLYASVPSLLMQTHGPGFSLVRAGCMSSPSTGERRSFARHSDWQTRCSQRPNSLSFCAFRQRAISSAHRHRSSTAAPFLDMQLHST